MVTNALVQARIDSIIKEEATAVLATMGLTVSEAVRLLLTRVAYEQTLPFGLLTPNTETVAAMQEAQWGNLPSAATMEQFIDAMNAED